MAGPIGRRERIPLAETEGPTYHCPKFIDDSKITNSIRAEEIPQSYSRGLRPRLLPRLLPGIASIELSEAQLEWTDQPTVILVQRFERRAAIEIERADIPMLLDFIGVVLDQHSKRQALRSANIGTILVDTASALLIQKRTASHGMRLSILQEIGMGRANPIRFDVAHREVIETTTRTAPAALQAFRVYRCQRVRFGVDLSV